MMEIKMPKPTKGETGSQFIQRCVQVLRQEEPGKPLRECLGKCYGLWRQAHPDDETAQGKKRQGG